MLWVCGDAQRIKIERFLEATPLVVGTYAVVMTGVESKVSRGII